MNETHLMPEASETKSMEWSTAVQVIEWCVDEMLDKITSGPTTMVRAGPKKSWKHGTGFCGVELMVAFLVVVNFCVQVMGPPRCGHIEDNRGPYHRSSMQKNAYNRDFVHEL